MKINHLSYNLAAHGAKKAIVLFFIQLVLAFTAWYYIAGTFLKKERIIDQPLTNFITIAVVKSINLISPPATAVTSRPSLRTPGNNLVLNNKTVVAIYDSCNSIDLMFTYVIVILLLPSTIKRKIAFSLGGIAVITFVNIIRIIALYYIYRFQKEAFSFSHDYLFTILMDILIFWGWLMFVNKKSVA